MLTKIEIKEKFGSNPLEIGFLASDYWLVTELDAEDIEVEAQPGDLCVVALDGDDIDISATLYESYIGTVQDPVDEIYRYYYFSEIDCSSMYNNDSTRCKECNVAVECYGSIN